ncbi:mannose-1-phosphate guanylyltransferase [Angustibacter luteus]|uniref:Mannose-1-phosphate guanylyltransferase n=1 Tax=Angustibacter luteus TaxID=658456 RepID=A0ABW1JHD7_9ACTN
MIADLTAVVPAGGAGTRLWPLSRRAQPKFLLDLTGTGRTLLQQTWDRLDDVAARVCVVTGAGHAGAVARQLPGLDLDDLLAEPSPRDSAAAIGLAAAVVHARDPQAVIGSFAADHVIADAAAFAAAVGEAVAVARTGLLVTIGITPTHPATGFGYIRAGAALDVPDAPSALAVAEFVEKPDAETAAGYVAQGYRWNAGMFVARASVLLDLLAEYRPALAEGLRVLGAAWDGPDRQRVLDEVWPQLEKVAVDYAVAEPAAAAGRVAVVPGAFGWDDVGDFDSLGTVLPAGDLQVIGDGELLATDSTGVVVTTSGRVVALIGLHDVVVVDTPDAVLVAARSHAQQVKGVVDRLTAAGRTDLL